MTTSHRPARPRISRRVAVTIGGLLCTAIPVAVDAQPASASAGRINMTMVSAGLSGHIGFDSLDDGGLTYVNGNHCNPGGDCFTDWDSSGAVENGGLATGSARGAHVEIYPDSTPSASLLDNYDVWTQPVGGAHMWFRPIGSPAPNIGALPLPGAVVGDGSFRLTPSVVSARGVAANRLIVNLFQLDSFRSTSGGWDVGAFSHGFNHTGTGGNGVWNTGVIWPAQYIVDIADTATGTAIFAVADLRPGAEATIDLDASCFGFDTCTYLAGGPVASGGGFHPLSPSRILDTRVGVGIANGAVRPGDGREGDIDPTYRRELLDNHQLKITGVGGVPDHGVSAVLLNVTVTQPTAAGYLSLYPKLPRRSDVFNDQAWFRTTPATSNLNFLPNDTLPNLVLARVGAGGKIFIDNLAGNSHVVADVVGWFDSGTGGAGFTGITPQRLLDTRDGTGNLGAAFHAFETRDLQVTRVKGVPADASAVVLNVTVANPNTNGYLTVSPTGEPRPTASNLNTAPGMIRPNLVVAKVGAGGKVAIYHWADTTAGLTDVIVDVVGYYGPGGGQTFSVDPARIMDSRAGIGTAARAFGTDETRSLQVTGVGGVPENATAVIVNVTGTEPAFGTFVTVWPDGPIPEASNLNLSPGQTAPNLVMVKVSPGGTINLYNHVGPTHLIVDVMGYVN